MQHHLAGAERSVHYRLLPRAWGKVLPLSIPCCLSHPDPCRLPGACCPTNMQPQPAVAGPLEAVLFSLSNSPKHLSTALRSPWHPPQSSAPQARPCATYSAVAALPCPAHQQQPPRAGPIQPPQPAHCCPLCRQQPPARCCCALQKHHQHQQPPEGLPVPWQPQKLLNCHLLGCLSDC